VGDYGQKSPQIVFLLPQDIKISKRYNVRLYHADELSKAEESRIRRLSLSLESSGQLDDLIITPEHYLIAGHRRRQAAILLNELRDSNFKPLFRLRCRIDDTGGDLRLKAITSNLHRRDSSPMDLCYLLYTIRQEKGWQGPTHTRDLAKYLTMDDSTINALEHLMRLEPEMQNMLHEGIISLKTCQDLQKSVPTVSQRVAIVARAAEIQQEDTLDKAMEDYSNGRKSLIETTRSLQTAPRIRVQHPSVMKALRERAATTKLPLTRQELITSIAQFDAPIYSRSLRDFARYWIGDFAHGRGSQDELIEKALAL